MSVLSSALNVGWKKNVDWCERAWKMRCCLAVDLLDALHVPLMNLIYVYDNMIYAIRTFGREYSRKINDVNSIEIRFSFLASIETESVHSKFHTNRKSVRLYAHIDRLDVNSFISNHIS